MGITLQRAADRAQQLSGVIGAEGEAIAHAVAAVSDAVLQTTRLTHDRDGAVTQRHHLGESAGLTL